MLEQFFRSNLGEFNYAKFEQHISLESIVWKHLLEKSRSSLRNEYSVISMSKSKGLRQNVRSIILKQFSCV